MIRASRGPCDNLINNFRRNRTDNRDTYQGGGCGRISRLVDIIALGVLFTQGAFLAGLQIAVSSRVKKDRDQRGH
jgi:hypothetical protein